MGIAEIGDPHHAKPAGGSSMKTGSPEGIR